MRGAALAQVLAWVFACLFVLQYFNLVPDLTR